MNNNTRTLKIPNWCKTHTTVLVRYPDGRTGDNTMFYKECIIGYTDNGFLTQAHSCPIYEHRFAEYGKTVLEAK